MTLLLDTCTMIFIAERTANSKRAIEAIQAAYDRSEAVYYSPISAWEVGQLVSRGRLTLAQTPARWFQSSVARGGLIEAVMTNDILIASSFLPDSPLRDPADKIIAATAREFDYTVLTSDRLLLRYAAEGHMRSPRMQNCSPARPPPLAVGRMRMYRSWMPRCPECFPSSMKNASPRLCAPAWA